MMLWKDFVKARRLSRMKARMILFGQIFDTIDATLINAKMDDESRVKFWLKFISNIEYRQKFIQDMIDKNK